MGLFDSLKFEPCDELTALLADHFKTCEHCRGELQHLLEIPAVEMLARRLPKKHQKLLEGVKP